MNLPELIRDVIKEKMKEKGFKTLTAYSKASGVSQSYLSKIFDESKSVDITTSTLEKLIKPLEFTLSDFFEEVEKKSLC